MKKYILYLLTGMAACGFCGCEDALDRFPKDRLTPDEFFHTEEECELYTNDFYTIFPSGASIYNETADIITCNTLTSEVLGNRTVPATASTWKWEKLRDINFFLQYSSNCTDDRVRFEYEGLARFFRAYFYFDKVRYYGDVPWVDRPLASDDQELYKGRDSREFVMQKVIGDLDFAIANLPAERQVYRVTRWTALALKSRACLFEGTFRKYHSIDGYEHDWKWYLEQAADAAEEFITNSGYSLYTATGPATSYRDLFASENAQSVEVILARDYNSALGVFHNANFYTISASYGKPGMTRKIVDSYLMADGSRFTDKAGWETMEFKQQCSNRDPRLAQTIRTPGYTRIGATTKLAPDLANSITGYHVVKFVTGTAQDAYNKSFNDLPIFRSAEVYLNFAEAKAELGTLTQEDINLSVKRLRDRVGMSNLILDDANKNPDPYLSDAKTGYPNVTDANKGVILEIRRERTIELAMEGFRYYDIMRWKEGKTFEQPLLGLYIPAKGEYDIDGDGTPDVYFATKGETPSTTAKLTLVIDQDILFSDGDHGYISPHKNNPGIWDETRDYFYPIPTDDRSLTGGALTQNPGWNDGLNF
mgnify:CR=1 FL=1